MARIVTVTLSPAIDRLYELNHLVPGSLNRVWKPTISAGGKGLNVARAGTVLGDEYVNIVVTGGRGGADWLSLASGQGLRIEAVSVSGNTRTCVKIVETGQSRLTELNEISSSITKAGARDILEAIEIESSLHKPDVIAICGSARGAAAVSLVSKTAEFAESQGIKLALDTSGGMLKAGVQLKPWLVKINRVELYEWLGGATADETDLIDRVRTAAGLTNGYVCVTDGARGSILSWQNRCLQIGAPQPGEFKGTVGSGDAYLAGLLHGLLEEPGKHELALRISAACGTANVESPTPGQIDAVRVKELMNAISAVDV